MSCTAESIFLLMIVMGHIHIHWGMWAQSNKSDVDRGWRSIREPISHKPISVFPPPPKNQLPKLDCSRLEPPKSSSSHHHHHLLLTEIPQEVRSFVEYIIMALTIIAYWENTLERERTFYSSDRRRPVELMTLIFIVWALRTMILSENAESSFAWDYTYFLTIAIRLRLLTLPAISAAILSLCMSKTSRSLSLLTGNFL